MALVTAWNKRAKQQQQVPAHYVDNPLVFGGVYTTLPKKEAEKPEGDTIPAPTPTPDAKSSQKKDKE